MSSQRNSICFNCHVPQRNSPPGHLRITGVVRTRTGQSKCRSESSVQDIGEAVGGSGPLTASTSIDLIDLSSEPSNSNLYANFNPGYKNTTPPDDITVQYPVISAPMLESAPTSLLSLHQPDNDCTPPRSLTEPNVRRWEDLVESELWQPRSPRASWAGPTTCPESPEFNIYGEVNVPGSPGPSPLRCCSPLTQINTRARVKGSSGLHRPLSSIQFYKNEEGLKKRSVSYHTMQCGHSSSAISKTQKKNASSPRQNYAEVWIPQISHRQSASFAELTPDGELKTSDNEARLTQSCEQLGMSQAQIAAQKRSKRRCPTPPRVLSPESTEKLKCEVIADI